MGPAILKITDGTTAGTVNLLGGPFYVLSWNPAIPDFKSGGVFIDPPLASGRRLAFFTYENATERIDFRQRSIDGDESKKQLAKLNNLLKKAAKHWTTNGIVGPVWIEARSTRESVPQYAKIVTGRITGLGNPFSSPYLQSDGYVVEPDLSLLLERRAWQDSEPGSPLQLALSGNSYTVNTLFNHSFESGISSWTVSGTNISVEPSTNYAYHGDFSGQISADSGTDSVYQDIIGLESGSSITCTVYALAQNGTAKLAIYDGGGFTNAVTDTTTSGSWTQLSVNKTVPAGGSIRFALEPSSTGDLVYFDYAFVDVTYGKPATPTTDKVYFLNGESPSPITHVFVDDGTVFGNNLINETLPYNLLPASPQVGDALYIGAADDVYGGGPFSSVVFNLSAGADVTIAWENSFTSGFSAMDVIDGTEGLSLTGEKILSISVPQNWASYTVNGVDAFWIRGRVTAVNSAGAATQASQDLFTVSDSFIEIPSTNLIGDEPPVINLDIDNDGGAIADNTLFFMAAGSDDGIWDDAAAGAGDCTSGTDTLGQEETALLRLTGLEIPQGATITSAFLYAISNGADLTDGGGSATYGIDFEDVANSTAFTCTNYEPGLRTFQDDLIEWTVTEYFGEYVGYWIATPDLSSGLQQIVDKGTWTSGNAITIRITDLAVGLTDYIGLRMRDSADAAWGFFVTWLPPGLYATKIIAGARKTSRGDEFRSHIYASPIQRSGIDVSTGINSSFIDTRTIASNITGGALNPFNNAIRVSVSPWEDGSMKDRMIVRIPSLISGSFTGKFRLFLRAYNSTTSDIYQMPVFRYRLSVGGESTYGNEVSTLTKPEPELIDLGTIQIPELSSGELGQSTEIAIQATRSTNYSFYLQNIILIPSDEWIVELKSPLGLTGVLDKTRTLTIDSMNGAGQLMARMLTASGSTVAWQASGSLFKPEINEEVRVWFVAVTDETIASSTGLKNASWSNLVFSAKAYILRRFNLYGGQL